MAEISTYFKLKMKNEEQINGAIDLLENAIAQSNEDKDIIGQFECFLEELKDNIEDNTVELFDFFDLSQYAYEVMFPDLFKAIAKKFYEDSFSGEAFQESYTDGSTISYKAKYKNGILELKLRLKGYMTDTPSKNGVISVVELNDFNFELNGIKEQIALVPTENKKPKDVAEFEVKNGTLKKYWGDSSEVVIPAEVVAIGSKAFNNCLTLKKLVISATVSKIASDAFLGCSNLEEIVVEEGNSAFHVENNCLIKKNKLILGCKNSIIPNSSKLKTVCAGAFCGRQLEALHIPKNITTIEEDAFSCVGLKNISVENGNSVYHSAGDCLIETNSKILILGCDNSVIPIDGSVVAIGKHAFAGSNIVEIIIPDSIQKLGWGAFNECAHLNSVTIGKGITELYCGEFKECTSLTNIVIPKNVRSVALTSFEGCANLVNISLPDELDSLWNTSVLTGCKKIHYNEYDNALYLGNINNPYLALIKAKNKAIESCNIHERTKIILEEAFKNCTALTSISIPNGVEEIGSATFNGCKQLSQIIFGNGIKSISYHAFEDCEKLSNIVIPNGVTEIYSDAFAGCSGLVKIYIPDSVKRIVYNPFMGCYNFTIYCEAQSKPNGWYGISKDGFFCDYQIVWGVKDSSVVENFKLFDIEDGILKKYNGNIEKVCVPIGVSSIAKEAFLNRAIVEEIIIPDGVINIGDKAFSGCKFLKKIIIPKSVTVIGEDAFYGCDKLKIIIIDSGNKNYKIKDGDLYNYDGTHLIKVLATKKS